jgi:hypothetical protein
MKMSIEERLTLLELQVAELRAAAGVTEPDRDVVREVLFYSDIDVGDDMFFDGSWSTVVAVDDTGQSAISIELEDGRSMDLSWSTQVLRRCPRSRLPKKPNAKRRSRRGRIRRR